MAYTKGGKYDVYMSFSPADDFSFPNEPGWVTRLTNDLVNALKMQLGAPRSLEVFRPNRIDTDAFNEDEFRRASLESALMVCVVSRSYVEKSGGEKPFTLRELESFVEANGADRVYVVEVHPNKSSNKILRSKIANRFWDEMPSGRPQRFDPTTPEKTQKYRERVSELAQAIGKQLREMRDSSGRTPPRQSGKTPPRQKESGTRTVLPAQQRLAAARDVQVPGSIFISYRRSDEPSFAGRVYDWLGTAFSKERLFMDVDNIPIGTDFVDFLSLQVNRCEVLLAIIGKNWRGSEGKDDRGRIDREEDYVRIEIAAALQSGKKVIPVLVGNAQMVEAADLPPSLKPLARRNAVRITHERFGTDIEVLIRSLQSTFGSTVP